MMFDTLDRCHHLTCARCEHDDVCMDDGGRTCDGCGVALHAECECPDCGVAA